MTEEAVYRMEGD